MHFPDNTTKNVSGILLNFTYCNGTESLAQPSPAWYPPDVWTTTPSIPSQQEDQHIWIGNEEPG